MEVGCLGPWREVPLPWLAILQFSHELPHTAQAPVTVFTKLMALYSGLFFKEKSRKSKNVCFKSFKELHLNPFILKPIFPRHKNSHIFCLLSWGNKTLIKPSIRT